MSGLPAGVPRACERTRASRCARPFARALAFAVVLVLVLVIVPRAARAEEPPEPAASMRAFERDGLHFQVAFGWGGGPTSHGLVHNMELGGTFDSGLTLCYEHAFIWSRGIAEPDGGSDLWGGHFFMVKVPLADFLVYKAAVGIGENVDMTDGFKPRFGLGMTMGLDLDFPIWPTSGVSLSLLVLHVATVDRGQQVGAGATVGYTWF